MRRLPYLLLPLALVGLVGCDRTPGGLVELETVSATDDVVRDLTRTSVQLGTPESDELVDELAAFGTDASTGLRHEPDPGRVAFAFVFGACAVDETTLIVEETEISVEFTEDVSIDCASAAAHVATFEIAEDDVPRSAVLADPRRSTTG